MNCMKCGREVKEGQVFCFDCLAEMENYPVKPGTVVQLPRRKVDATVYKKAAVRRRVLTPEEQVKRLKNRVYLLTAVILVQIILICMLLFPVVKDVFEDSRPKPGQNYSSLDDPEPTENGWFFESLGR